MFDRDERLEELHELGDPLSRLDDVIEWGVFEPVLDQIQKHPVKGPGGRPAFAPLMMFKALVIQSLYGLSDAQMEFQVTDRLSFKRFLGLSNADSSPDEKTFWAFRETLNKAELFDLLFETFHRTLEANGMIARKGQMIDATFIEVPRQRNPKEENAQIKVGKVPEAWEDQPAKARQKDVDARWTRKHDRRYYGYKNHVKVDSKSKLITKYVVTDASVHDSQPLDELLQKGDPTTYADSAYSGESCQNVFDKYGVEAKPIERAWRNRPLNGTQKRVNRARSKTRARVEHVFGMMSMCIRATMSRCIGMARNSSAIAMVNLVYNMIRFEQIERLGLKNWRAV